MKNTSSSSCDGHGNVESTKIDQDINSLYYDLGDPVIADSAAGSATASLSTKKDNRAKASPSPVNVKPSSRESSPDAHAQKTLGGGDNHYTVGNPNGINQSLNEQYEYTNAYDRVRRTATVPDTIICLAPDSIMDGKNPENGERSSCSSGSDNNYKHGSSSWNKCEYDMNRKMDHRLHRRKIKSHVHGDSKERERRKRKHHHRSHADAASRTLVNGRDTTRQQQQQQKRSRHRDHEKSRRKRDSASRNISKRARSEKDANAASEPASSSCSNNERGNIVLLNDLKSSRLLLINKNYIMSFVFKLFPQVKITGMTLESLVFESHRRKEDALDPKLDLIRQVTHVLLSAMGFDYSNSSSSNSNNSNSNSRKMSVGDDNDILHLQPLKGKPVESASSAKKIILLQTAIAKSSSADDAGDGPSLRNLMGEMALAYRLAAHFALDACEKMRQYYGNDSEKVRKMNKLQGNAVLTLVVSLRKTFVELMDDLRNDGNDDGDVGDVVNVCPVGENMRLFFTPVRNDVFSEAEILLADCVTLLTDLDADGGIHAADEKRRHQLVENILKLDRTSRETASTAIGISQGLIELIFRQLPSRGSSKPNAPKRSYLEKLKCHHELSGGALGSTMAQPTAECEKAIATFTELRKKQMKLIVEVERMAQGDTVCPEPPLNDPPSVTSRQSEMEGNTEILRIDGCIYLSKIMRKYEAYQKQSQYKSVCAKTHPAEIEHMALYLFHALMNNVPDNDKEGPLSIQRKVNLKSAVLAAVFLATKILDSAVSLRRILGYAKEVPTNFLGSRSVQYGAPYKTLIKNYEQQLMLLHGYSAPETSDLPYFYISAVAEYLCLGESQTTRFKLVFQHVGYKCSASCLLGEPLLVAFSVFHFGSRHLHLLDETPQWNEVLESEDLRCVEMLSGHMKEVYMYERGETSSKSSSASTPELSESSFTSLSSLLEEMNS